MSIDWLGYLEKVRPEKGWEDADGPESGVGDSYWYVSSDGTFARLMVDQGHAELSIVPQDEDMEDDMDLSIWSGDLEDAANDADLAEFVGKAKPDPENKVDGAAHGGPSY